MQGGWKIAEERFFFEYLRIAGDRTKQECAKDISQALRSKTPPQVVDMYDSVFAFLAKKIQNAEAKSSRQRHKLLVRFYDNYLGPEREKEGKKKCKQCASADENPSPSSEDIKTASTAKDDSLKQSLGCEACAQVSDQNKECSLRDMAIPAPMEIRTQILSAPFIEVLFVPQEEFLRKKLSSCGFDPSPRMKFEHSKSVLAIVKDLQIVWEKALKSLSNGSIWLQAPDESPLRAFKWGDSQRDFQLTIADLLIAMQVATPATIKYSWKENSAKKACEKNMGMNNTTDKNVNAGLAAGDMNQVSKKSRSSALVGQKKSYTDMINSNSIDFQELNPAIQFPGSDDGEIGCHDETDLPANHEPPRQTTGTQSTRKASARTEKRKKIYGNEGIDSKIEEKEGNPAAELLRNAWMQYAGAMHQINNYNSMNENKIIVDNQFSPNAYNWRGMAMPINQVGPILGMPVANPQEQIPQNMEHKEDTLFNLFQKEDSKLGISLAEALRVTCNGEQQKPVESFPGDVCKGLDFGDPNQQWTLLSPPSSFKLPPGFENSRLVSPARSLKDAFDSCLLTPPGSGKKNKVKPSNENHPTEEIINPSISLFSILDGLSNSQWIAKLENDVKENSDKEDANTQLEQRPFARLFG